jgi:hypothetical protein
MHFVAVLPRLAAGMTKLRCEWLGYRIDAATGQRQLKRGTARLL